MEVPEVDKWFESPSLQPWILRGKRGLRPKSKLLLVEKWRWDIYYEKNMWEHCNCKMVSHDKRAFDFWRTKRNRWEEWKLMASRNKIENSTWGHHVCHITPRYQWLRSQHSTFGSGSGATSSGGQSTLRWRFEKAKAESTMFTVNVSISKHNYRSNIFHSDLLWNILSVTKLKLF